MSDWLHKLLAVIDHNRYLALSILGIALCAGLLFTTQGCQSTTLPVMGTEPVTRAEFDIQAIETRATLEAKRQATISEIEAFNQRIEVGYADLDAKDQIRRDIIDTASIIVTQAGQGAFNPLSLIPLGILTAGSILGIGAGLDNRKKDAEIVKRDAVIAEISKTSPS